MAEELFKLQVYNEQEGKLNIKVQKLLNPQSSESDGLFKYPLNTYSSSCLKAVYNSWEVHISTAHISAKRLSAWFQNLLTTDVSVLYLALWCSNTLSRLLLTRETEK